MCIFLIKQTLNTILKKEEKVDLANDLLESDGYLNLNS